LPKSDDERRVIAECMTSGRDDCVAESEVEALMKHLSERDAFRQRWPCRVCCSSGSIPQRCCSPLSSTLSRRCGALDAEKLQRTVEGSPG
jgi:hypothetical protein